MKGLQLQHRIFEQIKSIHSDKTEMVKALSQILGISENAVYKRLTGNTAINIEDLVKICSSYKIPIDRFLQLSDDTLVTHFPPLKNIPSSYTEYLQPILQLAYLGDSMNPNDIELWYATNEFPFYHYFFFQDLNYFKYHIWAWSTWELEGVKNSKISLKHQVLNDDNFLASTEKIASLYMKIKSYEWLSLHSIYNTLEQIKYFLKMEKFEKSEDALKLCHTLKLMVKHFERMAEAGKKFRPNEKVNANAPSIEFYNISFLQTNNVCLFQSPLGNMVFNTFDNPNTIQTQDQRMCDYTLNWFHKLKKRSTPFSSVNELDRINFFKKIYIQIQEAEDKVKTIIKS